MGDNGPPAGGKRRLIREGGGAGGGAVATVSPQRMTIDDVFQTVEQSGGGPQLPPPHGFDGMNRRDYG